MEKKTVEREYVTKPSKGRRDCTGCVALGEIKRVVHMDGDTHKTLCFRLGHRCLKENIVWVVKPKGENNSEK